MTNRIQTFLKRLQAAGRSNMYGAVPYVMRQFGLDREAAFKAVCAYLDGDLVREAAPSKPSKRKVRRAR